MITLSLHRDALQIQQLAVMLDMELEESHLQMDTDDDNKITYKEFSQWWRMRRAFDKIDTDKSGTLDAKELAAFG